MGVGDIVEAIGQVTQGVEYVGADGVGRDLVVHIVPGIGAQDGAGGPVMPGDGGAEAKDEFGKGALVAVEVFLVDDAVVVYVGKDAFDGFALLVVLLVIDIKCVGVVTDGIYLNDLVAGEGARVGGVLCGGQVGDLVVVPGDVEVQVPAEIFGLYGYGVDDELDAL